MAGQQDGEIPIAEAAALLGLSQEAVRKRIQRGTLVGHKRGGHWYVVLGRQDEASGRQDSGRTVAGQPPPPEVMDAAYRVTPAEIEQAVARTAQQYTGDMATVFDRVAALYEAQLAAKDETIAALRRRAEVSEAERDALQRRELADRLTAPLPAVEQATERVRAGGASPAVAAPAGGFWAGLGRWWRGAR